MKAGLQPVGGVAGGGRAGIALLLVLAAILLLESLAAVALRAAVARLRLAGDNRIALEGDLLAASALASARIGADSQLAALPDGGRFDLPAGALSHGWQAERWAVRQGDLIRLAVVVTLRASDGTLLGARRRTLLIGRVAADTVRVSGYRPRY